MSQKALNEKNPTSSEQLQLGLNYYNSGQLLEAEDCLRRVLQKSPQNIIAWTILGDIYCQQDNVLKAIRVYLKAIEIDGNLPIIYNNLGNLYFRLGKSLKAIECYKRAIDLKPEHQIAYDGFLLSLNYSCCYDSELIYGEHLRWGSLQQKIIDRYDLSWDKGKRLRIGYVFGDLSWDGLNNFLEPILGNENSDSLEVVCYSNYPIIGGVTSSLAHLVSVWRNIYDLEDGEVIELIKEDCIDILVDLVGHNKNNRLLVFANKVVPIQVSYLGYLNTTGLDTIDYRLTDNYVDPQGTRDGLYTEELFYLSDGLFCYGLDGDIPEVNNLPVLDRGYITFGCGVDRTKINPDTISDWSEILQRVPNSKLLLKTEGLINNHLLKLFEKQGVDWDRIEFRSYDLSFYHGVDIALDTFPVNGMGTTCDAILMGVPVISKEGKAYSSRIGVSLLSGVGVTEFIAKSSTDYIDRAISLAKDIKRLSGLRNSLRDKIKESSICNSSLFNQSLEEAYRFMWEKNIDRQEVNIILDKLKLAIKFYKQRKTSQAEFVLKQVLEIKENYNRAWELLGDTYFLEPELYEKSIRAYQKAIACDRDYSKIFMLYYKLAKVYKKQGKSVSSIAHLNKAIDLNPSYANAYYELANIYQEREDYKLSIQFYHLAISHKADWQEAYYNLAFTYQQYYQFSSAIRFYKKAIELKNNCFASYNNLGLVYEDRGEFSLAEECFKQAIILNPNRSEFYNNLARVYGLQGKFNLALKSFSKGFSLEDNRSNIKYLKSYQESILSLNYSEEYTPLEITARHRELGKIIQRYFTQTNNFYDCYPNPERRLRIGYVMGELKDRDIFYFLEPIITHHNRDLFQIFCYINNDRQDLEEKTIKVKSDYWKEIYKLEDEEVIKIIREDKIDILVDLSGHTKGNRLEIFSHKPSPIQVTYLGYPNTTGLEAIDYFLTDENINPFNTSEDLYTEELIRLPHGSLCYQTPTLKNTPPINSLPAINRNYITFGCFNDWNKINPDLIIDWAKILNALPKSRLLLKSQLVEEEVLNNNFSSLTRERIYKLFADRGIDKERLEIWNGLSTQKERLYLYHQIDIALDTFPYNGMTNTCEAIWMGVPVITKIGNTSSSRIGSSLLSSVWLQEFICESSEDYINKAIDLANNIESLQNLRTILRDRMEQAPLTNNSLITQSIEDTYRHIWQKWCNTQKYIYPYTKNNFNEDSKNKRKHITISNPKLKNKVDERFTILTVYHLSPTPHSLITQSLAVMPKVVCLKNLNPLLITNPSNDSDPINQSDLLTPEDLLNIFKLKIKLIVDRCQKNDRKLLIGQHINSNSILEKNNSQLQAIDNLKSEYNFKTILILQNPIDSWLELLKQKQNQQITTFDRYCDFYIQCLENYNSFPSYLYENFIADSDKILQQICQYYDLDFDPNYQQKLSHTNPQNKTKLNSGSIKIRPRKTYEESFLKEIKSSPKFAEICQKVGYHQITD